MERVARGQLSRQETDSSAQLDERSRQHHAALVLTHGLICTIPKRFTLYCCSFIAILQYFFFIIAVSVLSVLLQNGLPGFYLKDFASPS